MAAARAVESRREGGRAPLFELTNRDLPESEATDDLREALRELPGGLYDESPPATEMDWRRRTGIAFDLVDRHVADRDGCDLTSSLLRVAHSALRSLVEASETSPEYRALRRIKSAHITAVHEAFMANALDGRLREALADIRDALAVAIK